MHVGSEDLGILYTMMTVFFLVTALTVSFGYHALKAESNPDETDPQARP